MMPETMTSAEALALGASVVGCVMSIVLWWVRLVDVRLAAHANGRRTNAALAILCGETLRATSQGILLYLNLLLADTPPRPGLQTSFLPSVVPATLLLVILSVLLMMSSVLGWWFRRRQLRLERLGLER